MSARLQVDACGEATLFRGPTQRDRVFKGGNEILQLARRPGAMVFSVAALPPIEAGSAPCGTSAGAKGKGRGEGRKLGKRANANAKKATHSELREYVQDRYF